MTEARTAPSSRVERGFTLIELLAVLAVVGILTAIIVPIIQDSVERSRQVKSRGNMRHIGELVALFSADSAGSLPSGWDSSKSQMWTQVFAVKGLADPENEREAFVCPLMESEHADENEDMLTSYAMNNFLGDRVGKPVYSGISKVGEATDPSRTALLFNSFYNVDGYRWKFSATSSAGYNKIIPADGEHVYVLFLDGSVRALLSTDEKLYSSGRRGSEEWLFWKGTKGN